VLTLCGYSKGLDAFAQIHVRNEQPKGRDALQARQLYEQDNRKPRKLGLSDSFFWFVVRVYQ